MNSKSGIKRRDFLRYAGVAGLAVGTAPAIIENALSTSGEVNALFWSDYMPESFLSVFTAETGIKVNHTGVGDNADIINKMKATKGVGFDVASPTNMRAPQWEKQGLLQPIDMNRVDVSGINPTMVEIGTKSWNFGGKGSHWLPQMWGTEGIGWRTDLWSPKGGVPSYGDLWQPEVKGKTMGRTYSMMTGTGLYLETTGVLNPGDMWKAYTSPDAMRPVWDKLTKYCIDNKDQIKLFWMDGDSQKNGLLSDGVVVGQTWDGPILALQKAGEPIKYQAPREGAFAWVDGITLSAGAKNIDQVYELIKYLYKPDLAGKAIDTHGYNTPVIGGDKYANADYAKAFKSAYPGDALSNLNPWPSEPVWYADARAEYANRFQNA